jgi:hypothetical protein
MNAFNAFPWWDPREVVMSDVAVVVSVVGVVGVEDGWAVVASGAFLTSVITRVSVVFDVAGGEGGVDGHGFVDRWGWQEVACSGGMVREIAIGGWDIPTAWASLQTGVIL